MRYALLLLLLNINLFSAKVMLEIYSKEKEICFSNASFLNVSIKKVETNVSSFRVKLSDLGFNDVIKIKRLDKKIITYVCTKDFSKIYEGDFILKKERGDFFLVNEVADLDYLASVVGSEIGVNASMEALRVQAVLSRTLYYYLMQNPSVNYISSLAARAQAYRGANYATADTYEALIDTKGEVLTHKGRVIYPYFHSTSAGIIFPPSKHLGLRFSEGYKSNVFLDPAFEALHRLPHYEWRGSISLSKLKDIFHFDKDIKSLSFKSEKYSIVKEVSFQLVLGSISNVKSYLFKKRLEEEGFSALKSVCFTAYLKDGILYFHGYGFGHLSGLPQTSVEYLVWQGESYKSILLMYYNGVLAKYPLRY